MLRARPHLVLALLATFAAAAALAWQPEPLPREREIAAALAAGPPGLADAAGVWVLGSGGYERARPSRNGFECLVERSHPAAFEPQCFDAEGAATLLQAVLLRAELRARGLDEKEVAAAVAAAWSEGRLRAPRRPGINYMLSPENRVPIDEEGKTVIPFPPHLMFYVPYLTNADLGSDGAPDAPVFVIAEGTPGAYAIVPVPTGEEPGGHP